MCVFLSDFGRIAAYIRLPDVAELNHNFFLHFFVHCSKSNKIVTCHRFIIRAVTRMRTQTSPAKRNVVWMCETVGIVKQAGWNEHIYIACCSCCCLFGRRCRGRALFGQSIYRW